MRAIRRGVAGVRWPVSLLWSFAQRRQDFFIITDRQLDHAGVGKRSRWSLKFFLWLWNCPLKSGVMSGECRVTAGYYQFTAPLYDSFSACLFLWRIRKDVALVIAREKFRLSSTINRQIWTEKITGRQNTQCRPIWAKYGEILRRERGGFRHKAYWISFRIYKNYPIATTHIDSIEIKKISKTTSNNFEKKILKIFFEFFLNFSEFKKKFN